jgi:hypothetical protein
MAAAEVPQEIKQAILLKIADFYEHRCGDEGFGIIINDAIENHIWPERINVL